ncbi:MAG: type I pullulanase [Bacilli bacterium]|nr:type I pullulanase [Bacilli bacterium]MDY6430197.1 type I pullulanase [Bacilli bacterium]
MKDTYVNAKLITPDTIRLCVFSSLPWEKLSATLYEDGKPSKNKLSLSKVNTLSSVAVADFKLSYPLELGHSYFFVTYQYGPLPLDVTEATSFQDFDSKYFYSGNDLGSTYTKNRTKFALWAPLASKVVLKIKRNRDSKWELVDTVRDNVGIFRVDLEGDYKNYLYKYIVTNNEIETECVDPYAKGSTANGQESVVIDFESIGINLHNDALPIINSPTDSIIYEAHVRDMTIDPSTDIKEKGKFLGMIEEGRKTEKGRPAGFDYICSLGITHLQLLPIYDYRTVDELHPNSGYNWGYDPDQYFVPEGSYASSLEDPLSRIIDLKKLVSSFHSKGIRIVMDVVFNHVYEYQTSNFEKVVPNYYFRHKHNGQLANTSGCGNDLASERLMVRKLIVDACKFWIEEYGIDGFRFDLMGIIDVYTLNEIKEMALRRNKNFILYGEGWNMGGEVNIPLGHMGNNKLLSNFGFFNDFYRESMKNYFLGDYYNFQNFKNAFTSSSLNFVVPPKFIDARQTINYVECHDNSTFFDFISRCKNYLKEEDKLRLMKVALGAILTSFGIPFIHMGQEIGQSKWGEDNTYNKGDGFNKFSYRLLDERYEMVEFLRLMTSLRRKLSFLRIYDPRVIDDIIFIEEKEKCLIADFRNPNLILPYSRLTIFINPGENAAFYHFDDQVQIVVDKNFKESKEMTNDVEIPPYSFIITGKK